MLFYLLRDTNNILLFLAEKISLIQFYVQDIYQENQLRTRLDKRPDIISGKASVASVNGAGGWGEVGTLSPQAGILVTQIKFPGSNEHLDWLKIICR